MMRQTAWFLLFGLSATAVLRAAEDPVSPTAPPDAPSIVEITPRSREAVARGLAFLASRQARNGAVGDEYPVAVTSLACLAFMADGNQPGQGRYGENVTRGISYLLGCASRTGYIAEPGESQSRMHGHGFAVMFLAEASGMSETLPASMQARLREVLEGGVRCIERSQSPMGGWYYTPGRTLFDEGSVTVCAVAALRAARNAGLSVEKGVIDRAILYLKKSASRDGSFKYSLSMGAGRSSAALTAAAVSTLNFAGEYRLPEVEAGLKYLQQFKPGQTPPPGHQFYGDYYAALAMFQAGGAWWDGWFPLIREDLLRRRSPDGTWQGEYTPEYCTSLACLVLEIPSRYLPIFQR